MNLDILFSFTIARAAIQIILPRWKKIVRWATKWEPQKRDEMCVLNCGRHMDIESE